MWQQRNKFESGNVASPSLARLSGAGVTTEKVLERNKRIEKGSKILWDYIQNIVKDAVEKGYLKEK
ncbi:MAG: hypothetical protein ACM3YE_16405 [Bacteroidota bacterium]